MTALPLHLRGKERISGTRRSALETARGRMVFVSAIFALLYVMIAARLVDLTIIQGELRGNERGASIISGSGENPERSQNRADIVDRNGVLLATSLETPSLYADPALIREPEKTAAALVEIIPGLTYGDVLQKLQHKGRFIWIKRNLTPQEQYAVLTLGEPGLEFRNEMRRIYPQGPLAAHMVGFTDVDGHGLAGVERSFDGLLNGSDDEPLRVTLDIRIQHAVRRELMQAIADFSAKGGAGVVMDIETGEILAAVSLPDFDPHDAGNAGKDMLFNRLTLGVYEMGSTFKIFSTAALLETLGLPMGTAFDAREPIKRGRFTISDFHPEKRDLTIPEVFMYSSNIGAALMGEKVGTKVLRGFYEDLGLLSPSSLEIEEIGKPLYPQPWRDINTLTASYGHGIAVSPLQLVAAAGGIIGDGTLVHPTLILHDRDSEKSQKSPEVRIVSPQTAHRMRQLLRLVVTNGTGKSADVPGYSMGGKTGTAEQPGAKGGYDEKRLISSFIGFFPMEAPRYAVFAMVDEPKGTKSSFGYATGAWVAAPAVGSIVLNMASIMGISPGSTPPEQDMAAGLKQYLRNNKEGKNLASFSSE